MALTWIYGLHAVRAQLALQPTTVAVLWCARGQRDPVVAELLALAAERGCQVRVCSRAEFTGQLQAAGLSANVNHQGVGATCVGASAAGSPANLSGPKDMAALLAACAGAPFFLVLDGVQDPHNLGACLRSACAAGVDAVFVPKDKSVGLTPVVHKVAAGAVAHLPVHVVTNLARTLRALKAAGVWVYGACDRAEPTLYDTDFSGPTALVLGAEGRGLRNLTRQQCDGLFSIPTTANMASLNVSVAAGVCLFEVVRQRR